MLTPRTLLPVLLVPVAFGAGLLLAGGEEPEADAGPVSAFKTIDVADRAVDIPGVKAVRVPALRDEPKTEAPAAAPRTGSPASTATEQPSAPSTSSNTAPTAPTPSTGGSGSTSGGSTSTPKQESGSTSGAVEEGSTGS